MQAPAPYLYTIAYCTRVALAIVIANTFPKNVIQAIINKIDHQVGSAAKTVITYRQIAQKTRYITNNDACKATKVAAF